MRTTSFFGAPRFRLALLCVLVFGAVQVALCLLIVVAGEGLAANDAPPEARRDSLRGLVAIAAPLGLAAAALAAWFVAGRLLAPLRRMALEARAIAPGVLGRRIDVPRTNDDVAGLATAFNELLDRLERAFDAQQRFIGDAAHQLKTPLASLSLRVQQRLAGAAAGEERRFVEEIRVETDRLVQTVDGLLALARVDAGLSCRTARAVALPDVASDAVARCHALATNHRVKVTTTLPAAGEGRDTDVLGEAELLRIMIENLVRNAIVHTEEGTPAEVRVGAHGPMQVRLTVRDRGPGIPPELLERVFDRFVSVRRHPRDRGGSGLGLPIAAAIARMHGGAISARNVEAGGSEFTVTLPSIRGGRERM